jgi:hypothetical protein
MTDRIFHDRVKSFAQELLGCNCPDRVFEHIELSEASGPAGGFQRIAIGGRLLVYLVAGVVSDEEVQSLLEFGTRDRDDGGFNRLRLVLLDLPAGRRDSVTARFEEFAGSHEKLHLHLLRGDQISIYTTP